MDSENQAQSDLPDSLITLAHCFEVEPKPFASSVPVIGPFIATIRQLWYNVAARWQDQVMAEQQNRLNRAVYEALVLQHRTLREQAQILHDHDQILYERGLEIGILAEGLAKIKLDKKNEKHS
jgi:hypothetical protein